MDIKRDPRIAAALYVIAVIGTVIAQLKGWNALLYVCKPGMLIILSLWFFFSSRRYGDRFTLLVQAGLFFSLLGDIALIIRGVDEFNFILGLAAFLIAQICYTMAFAKNASEIGDLEGVWISVLIAVIIAAYGFFFAFDLVAYLEELLVLPVIAYVVTILMMGIAAGFRYKRTYPLSFWLVLGGALLFIASDGLLVRHRFIRPIDMADTMITLSYAAAQFMIASGCLVHVLAPEEIRRRKAIEA